MQTAHLSLGFFSIKIWRLRECPLWQLRLALAVFPLLPCDFRNACQWVCVMFLAYYGAHVYYYEHMKSDALIYLLAAFAFSDILLIMNLKRRRATCKRIMEYRLKADLVRFSRNIRLKKPHAPLPAGSAAEAC